MEIASSNAMAPQGETLLRSNGGFTLFFNEARSTCFNGYLVCRL
jgi:hypothetical protein